MTERIQINQELSFTPDEVLDLLDARLTAMLDDPEITGYDARVVVAALNQATSWAPKIVERFAGVKGLARQYSGLRYTRQLHWEVNMLLAAYGYFEDLIVLSNGAQHTVRIGPLQVAGMDANGLNIRLPVLIAMPEEGKDGN